MNALRIFAHGGRRPLAGPARPADSIPAPSTLPTLWLAGPVADEPAPDDALLRLLTRAREPHETFDSAYTRKELELRACFAALDVAAAAALHRRLADPAAGDAVALAFARLVAPRRLRLLAVLADAPRRAFLREGGAR